MSGCLGYTSAEVANVHLGNGGTASITPAVPDLPALSGLQVFQQALGFDAAVARPLPAAVGDAGEATVR